MRKSYIVIGILIVAVMLFFTLPIVDKTSSSTTVVVDYTTRDIVHPSCFDQAGLTNNVDEMSLSMARDYHEMEIRDECSIERLPTGKTSLIQKLLE